MERDELISIIQDFKWPTVPLADRIIAAGWRRVPDDCVVVRRDDAQMIADNMWCESSGHDCGLSAPDRDQPIRDRLRQALVDQPTDERGEGEC